ncbi:scavenger receptor class F member 1-like [Mizuhopecten yessoensis]|uniref:scavenger receptor class F member 1-like n=1 Tax=Mizuhopecten yessoensis TaxID=6573 RepID=UPI000B45D70F|nr:scavenger receptor class F member 1-like [Mizuhopecten yessoensis]
MDVKLGNTDMEIVTKTVPRTVQAVCVIQAQEIVYTAGTTHIPDHRKHHAGLVQNLVLAHVILTETVMHVQMVSTDFNAKTHARLPVAVTFVRSHMVIVKVSCQEGFYGLQCRNNCPTSCGSSVCDKTSGDCSACQDGFWGSRCKTDCLDTCGSSVCEKTLGHCTECREGLYGSWCHRKCPYTCRNNVCEIKSGNCSECNDGFYGPTCANCSDNCLSRTCDFSGHCTGGCLDGQYGNMCERWCSDNCTTCVQDGGHCLACIDGNYGTSCARTCGNCEDKRCDITTGNCEPCQKDWTGQRNDVKGNTHQLIYVLLYTSYN